MASVQNKDSETYGFACGIPARRPGTETTLTNIPDFEIERKNKRERKDMTWVFGRERTWHGKTFLVL